MTTTDPCFLSIAEAGELLRTKALSPVELLQAHLAKIDALNPVLDAFITRTTELAMQQAKAAEAEITAGRWRGPMHGIPFGLKDMFETRGIRTTAHSRILADHIPTRDATVVSKLYEAGGVLLGKLATHEFAHGGPSFDLPWPPARNPWNTGHFTGGSSSGSGAAVAAGLAAGALGTDTGGSVRNPALLCGIVGFKPSFGRVSRAGVIPFSESCDHVGPLTRTVEDAAILLEILQGADPRDRSSANAPTNELRSQLAAGVKCMRIGFVRHFSEEDLQADPELRAAVDAALKVFEDLGAHVEDVRLRSLHDYYAVRILVSEPELFSLHLKNLQQRPGDYGQHFLARCLPACLFTSADYVNAQRERLRMIRDMQPFYEKYDAIISMGGGPAPDLADHKNLGSVDKWLKPSIGSLGSVTGVPTIALCCGFSRSGLPLGMQIHGRPWGDAAVLRIARAYEAATPWHTRRPTVSTGARAEFAVDRHTTEVNPDVDLKYRALATMAAQRAGLKLNEEQFALLLAATPYALTLAERVPRSFRHEDEMAAVFGLWRNQLSSRCA